MESDLWVLDSLSTPNEMEEGASSIPNEWMNVFAQLDFYWIIF